VSVTTTPTTSAPGRYRARVRPALAPFVLHVTAIVAIAAVTWAVFSRAFVNYDTLYALIWGRDLVHGRLPDYDVSLAPTPHPLAILVGALASLLGAGAGYTAMIAIAFASFGVLVWAVFRLGQAAFAWPVGLLAALVVATREPFLSQAVRAYVDVPFLALVVVAVVLEARRPRRGWPVLVLLGLAGLLRPEAWLLAAAYWLFLFPALDWRARVLTAGLAAAAPVLWSLSDLAVTGDALHSLSGTRETAETLGRPTGIRHVPDIMPRRLGEILRLPALVGGTAGLFLGLWVARARSLLPAAVAVLGGVAFVALAIAGLPLIGRYLFLPATMLAAFFSFAALGWREQVPGRLRRGWALGGAVLLVAFVAFAPANVSGLDGLRDGIQLRGRMSEDLHSLTTAPVTGRLLRACSPIYVSNHRPVPILSFYLDRPPGDVRSALLEPARRGLFVAPANALVKEKFVLDPRDPRRLDASVPRDFRRVGGNRSWTLYERGC
jgi:hypothetical protein